MDENPYEPPKVPPDSHTHPHSAIVLGRRRLLTMVAITVPGGAGIVGGAAALSLVMPQAQESDYFLGLLAIATMVGGIAAAVVATVILKKLFQLIGLT